MLKKIDKIFIIIMTIALVINILAIGFLFVDSVSAAESNYTCQFEESTGDFIIDSVDFNEAGDYQCPPPGTTRVQVAIPGLTKTCTYKTWELDDQGEPTDVAAPCYYAASLPDFVRRIYTFSIGIIAVIAVFMIMIAGLTLIFAAGNAGAIARAKSRITVSILGVVLALLSYVILDTLNPRLTNLSLPGVTDINTKEQAGFWCSGFRNPDGTLKDEIKSIKDSSGKELSDNDNGDCKKQYTIELKDSRSSFTERKNKCWGDGCATGLTCLKLTSNPMCFNLKDLCNAEDNKCDEINEPIKKTPIKTCRQNVRWFGLSKKCLWADRWKSLNDKFKIENSIYGQSDLIRVNCSLSNVCLESNNCSDSNLANMAVDDMCVVVVSGYPSHCLKDLSELDIAYSEDKDRYVQFPCDKIKDQNSCQKNCFVLSDFFKGSKDYAEE